jgi:hypothetical protein
VFTVFACEPALQMNGVLRINLNVPWSEALQQRVSERFGPEAASMAKQLFDTGVKFENESKLFQILRQYKTPPENWPQILDAFTSESGKYHYGRLDINTASYEALRGLPGVTPEQAAQLARVREDLSEDERRTIAWPAIAQVLPLESFDALAGHITTRSWLYRVRLAAGEIPAGEPDADLHARVMYEAVIDLSSPTPRVAYLRDITALQSTAQMFAAAGSSADGFDDRSRPAASEEDQLVDSPSDDSTDAAQPQGLPSRSSAAGSPDPVAPKPSSRGARTEPSPEAKPASSPAPSSPADDHRSGRWRRGD